MEHYDLHWTDTPGHDLDICKPGDEEEWFAFYRIQLRRKRKKAEEERGVFASIGQEAPMGASMSDASQRSARLSKVGVLEHPGAF